VRAAGTAGVEEIKKGDLSDLMALTDGQALEGGDVWRGWLLVGSRRLGDVFNFFNILEKLQPRSGDKYFLEVYFLQFDHRFRILVSLLESRGGVYRIRS
jgi:hypothetical protein